MKYINIFHFNKINAGIQTANLIVDLGLKEKGWFEPPYGNNIDEYKNKFKGIWDANYIFINYEKNNGISKIKNLYICDYRNESKVEVRVLKEITTKEFINYIIEEVLIDIDSDLSIYDDYIRIVDSRELFNKISFFYDYDSPSIGKERKYSIEYDFENNHDINAIISTKSYRRLQDKSQIFSSSAGDHYRTRLIHTNEVFLISKTITDLFNKKLNKKNHDLININDVEAIALGHDVGHTPFGHVGERTLDDIISKENFGIIPFSSSMLVNKIGGFKHNIQSVRVLAMLENEGYNYRGVNIKYEVLEGILKHSSYSLNDVKILLGEELSNNLHADSIVNDELINKEDKEFKKIEHMNTYISGEIVKIADEIAQRMSDIEDAVKANLIEIMELIECLKQTEFKEIAKDIDSFLNTTMKLNIVDGEDVALKKLQNKIIKVLVHDFVSNDNVESYVNNNSINLIKFSDKINRFNNIIKNVINKKVIISRVVECHDFSGEKIIIKLFELFYKKPGLLPDKNIEEIFTEMLNNNVIKNYAIDYRNMNNKSACFVKEYFDILKSTEINQLYDIDDDVLSDIKKLGIKELKDKYSLNIFTKICKRIYFEQQSILIREICDYIAGMTDSFAISEYRKFCL